MPTGRMAWVTDPHLDHASPAGLHLFIEQMDEIAVDALLIGGDVGEAPTFAGFLDDIAVRVGCPVHFVLGNHDYYRGSIAEVREQAGQLSQRRSNLNWLPEAGVVRLSDRTALVGHGGWGDARSGDFLASDVVLTDYALIRELAETIGSGSPSDFRFIPRESILTPGLRDRLQQLGDEAAAHLQLHVREALSWAEHVIVLMHVPPFREACWHEGQLSDENWAPHFTCVAAGDVLRAAMESSLDQRMTVLCGHTHGEGRADILPNLRVITGGAMYGAPSVQDEFVEFE